MMSMTPAPVDSDDIIDLEGAVKKSKLMQDRSRKERMTQKKLEREDGYLEKYLAQ